MYVTIDGVDGVGKTTTCSGLKDALQGKPKLGTWEVIHSPTSPFDDLRRDVDEQCDPATRYLFYRSAVQHDARNILELRNQGISVVSDRSPYSTWAYHLEMDDTGRVRRWHRSLWQGLPTPDFTILLIADQIVREERIKRRGHQQSGGALSYDATLQNKVQCRFRTMALDLVIDTSHKTKDEVVEQITDEIQKTV